MASMDSFGDWFFWTWKIGKSATGKVQSPLWSYQLGFREGWIPTDPRTAIGTCAALGVVGPAFDGTYQAWQTGGAGAGSIAAALTLAHPWPPLAIPNAEGGVDALPRYTPTGPIVSLPPPTLTAKPGTKTATVDVGNGWFNSQDTMGAPTPISGCTYPDAWDAATMAVPPFCGARPVTAPTPTEIPTVPTENPIIPTTSTTVPTTATRTTATTGTATTTATTTLP